MDKEKKTEPKRESRVDNDLERALEQIRYWDKCYKRDSVQVILTHGVKAVPGLVQILTEILEDPSRYLQQSNRWGHMYALYILAFLQDSRALEPILGIFCGPDDLDYHLFEYYLGNDLSMILYRASARNIDALKRIVSERSYPAGVRGAAAEALGYCVVDDLISAEEAFDFLAQFYTLGTLDQDLLFLDFAANTLSDLDPARARELLLVLERIMAREDRIFIDVLLHAQRTLPKALAQLPWKISSYDIETEEDLHERLMGIAESKVRFDEEEQMEYDE